MKKAIYPGSFDPITKGHLDIIERSAKIFDEVEVVIMHNDLKHYLFSETERLDMIQQACKHIPNVTCAIGDGLSVEYAKQHQACAMIRGIRAVQDYEYELQTATANMYLDKNIETCFFMAQPIYSFISSSAVKEIASYHGDVSAFTDAYTEQKLKTKFNANQ